MISIVFFAEDKVTKHRTSSSIVFFDEMDDAVESLISINRERILAAMPECRVIAVIENEE